MKRAIGIVRVSRVHGRSGDKFMSPDIQATRIRQECARRDLHLTSVMEEMDVSGGKPLAQRPALSQAIADVEAGNAHAIVFAYRDRMDRSIDTQSELCRRMDAAGALLIADGQQITHATVHGWQQATLGSFLSENQRRVLGERMRDVRAKCVERGVAPHELPKGYRRREDGVAEPDLVEAAAVGRAFRQRADGRPITAIKRWLESCGIKQSESQVRRMLKNRIYLGELHVKGFEPNLAAHEPIVDRELFDAVQNFNGAPRGHLGKSNRLLARLKLLECGTCGSKLAVSQRSGRPGDYNFFYRCTNNTCAGRASISAPMIERMVVERVRELCEGLVGCASADGHCAERKQELEAAEERLGRLVRLLVAAESQDEPEAIQTVLDARRARNAAQEAYDLALAADFATRVAVTAGDVLDRGTQEGKRELIAAVIERVVVGRGRGPGRVAIEGRVMP